MKTTIMRDFNELISCLKKEELPADFPTGQVIFLPEGTEDPGAHLQIETGNSEAPCI